LRRRTEKSAVTAELAQLSFGANTLPSFETAAARFTA
jgi:hypothetical protein